MKLETQKGMRGLASKPQLDLREPALHSPCTPKWCKQGQLQLVGLGCDQDWQREAEEERGGNRVLWVNPFGWSWAVLMDQIMVCSGQILEVLRVEFGITMRKD